MTNSFASSQLAGTRTSQSKRGVFGNIKLQALTYLALALLLCFFNVQLDQFSVQAATYGIEDMSPSCREKLFPVSSGGKKDEKVSCTAFDEERGQIIIAGNTTSDDYAPAANEHAFAYAVDLDGNWRWGKFLYNVSFAVATVSGCKMDDNGTLMLLGAGDGKPVIMELNLADGTVTKFLSLEKIGGSEKSLPQYYTFAAIHHDVPNQMYYAAFVMDDYMQIVRVHDETREIVWNYQYFIKAANDGEAYLNFKVPGFLHQDPRDPTRMYLLGRFTHRGSVIKFNKENMNVDWKVEIGRHSAQQKAFSDMNEIQAYVQPPNSGNIFACGLRWLDALAPEGDGGMAASMFRMTEEGEVAFLYKWGADDPQKKYKDACRGISWDAERQEVVLILEATSPALRPGLDRYREAEGKSDVLLIAMRDDGGIVNAYNINMNAAAISMHVAPHGLFAHENYYIFGGTSYAYNTRYQSTSFDAGSPTLDTYVFKYDPSASEDCLYQHQFSSSEISANLAGPAQYLSPGDANSPLVYERTAPTSLFKDMGRQYLAYSSRYASAFDLQDSLRFPRMCASESRVLSKNVTYYRGQNEMAYGIAGTEAELVFNSFDIDKTTWLMQNGSNAEGRMGRFDPFDNGGTFYIQNNEESAVGIQRTNLRSCAQDQLYELYLYVQVQANKYPDFKTPVETKFKLAVGDVIEYKLPPLEDKEKNDEPEVFVAAQDGSADEANKYPPFMFFDNVTNTIIFRPDSIWYQGYEYRYKLVVKEKNSDTVFYEYFCDVEVEGDQIDKMQYLNFTDIDYNVTDVDRYSKGALVWSTPVNTTFVKENWDSMFDVYIHNVTWRTHKENTPLMGFEITDLGEDNRTMNYTAQFYDPYMLGLLKRRQDKLWFHWKYNLLDTEGFFIDGKYNAMILGNASETRFFPEKCQGDKEPKPDGSENYDSRKTIKQRTVIPLQFDFRNDEMAYFRSLAVKTYWYLVGVVAIQFSLLFIRNVGFLPLWTLIEYMQMCAFIPLYDFRMIPYLYDCFKPFLVSHLVLTNETFLFKEMQDDYFNINYDYYWLNTAKLGQSLALITCLFGVLILLNIIIALVWLCAPKTSKFGIWIGEILAQFKFNAYIRYYMLVYFDLTFFSVMKLVEGNESTQMRRIATTASYVIFTLSIVVPVLLMFIVCKRFEVMKIKQAKASFNTIVLKIDKQSRWRLIVPAYFFFRRLLTACLLSIDIKNTFIFLQYVFVLMSSHAWVLFLVAVKPYQSPLYNNYMLANETFYSALIIAIFIFSDATPELNIKFGAGVVLIVSIFLLIFANFIMIIILMCKGKAKLKEEVKQAKLRRAEKELMEEEEEEDRRQRQKREEEEFTRLPEDTTNMSQYDLSAQKTSGLTTEADGKKKKKKDKKKSKNKNNNDDVVSMGETNMTNSEIGNTTSVMNETHEPLKSKKKDKKKRRDKNKGAQDNVEETMLGPPTTNMGATEDGLVDTVGNEIMGKETQGKKTKGSSDEPSGSSSSDKKKAKKSKKSKKEAKDEDKKKDLL